MPPPVIATPAPSYSEPELPAPKKPAAGFSSGKDYSLPPPPEDLGLPKYEAYNDDEKPKKKKPKDDDDSDEDLMARLQNLQK
mmetsp:Transcript_40954/g.47058  ORF Transcript_40954/g.47058 Transcript_40954/m.47058 type:complete len:82 (-) Transcript_40954:37-282(-)